jgi:exodeoxyribonuclease VII large subunit
MSYLSLLELNELLKETIARQMEPSYWVVAEIGEMRLTQRGHCYLELIEKDEHSTLAKIRATLWSYNYRRLSGWFEAITGEPLRVGMKILSQVEINFHQVYGLSLNIKDIDANFTLGERARKKQEVLARLAEEGVLEMNKSLSLPVVPQRIAVISSPTAAGLGDFMDQLENNRYGYQFDVKLFKALMQGDRAAESITRAMVEVYEQQESGAQLFDLLVIIRGGGAQVDLDCFDGYDLAAHIAQFPLPVVTGIGHERDETVADMVAHTRMKTPTAVAEFLISGIYDFEEKLLGYWQRISQVGKHTVSSHTYEMDSLVQRLKFGVFRQIQSEKDRLQQLHQRLRYSSKRQLKDAGEIITQLQRRLKAESLKLLRRHNERLLQLEKFTRATDPEQILKKGFSYTQVNGKALQRNTRLKAGDALETLTYQHRLISRLENIEERKFNDEPKKKK